MKKVLWVIPKNIFPINDGAKKANHALLSSFSKLNVDTDLLIFNDLNDNEIEYRKNFNINKLFFIKRIPYTSTVKKIISLLMQFLRHPSLPITASFFAENFVKHEINTICKNGYDYIVFDGLHPYIGFNNIDKSKIIYRAHNVESDLWFTKASKTNNFFFKILLKWQGNKIDELECNIIKNASYVWTIAEEDKNTFKSKNPTACYKNIFVGLKFENKYHRSVDGINRFMFLGKLDWEPNKDGLIWFLKEIWPNVDKKKSKLFIAGSGNVSSIEPFLNQEGIEFLGFIKDVDQLYSTTDASIIPIQYGSGTRIKVIEAVSKKMPLISSQMGVQGSGLDIEDYFFVNSNQEWIDSINTFNSDLAIEKASKAYSKLEKIYDADQIAQSALLTLK